METPQVPIDGTIAELMSLVQKAMECIEKQKVFRGEVWADEAAKKMNCLAGDALRPLAQRHPSVRPDELDTNHLSAMTPLEQEGIIKLEVLRSWIQELSLPGDPTQTLH